MKTISTAMDVHVSGAVTTLCSCWKITRSDGVILGFTDHDRELIIDEIVYKASTGYYRSAISNSADSGVDNLDVSGFLDDNSLNEIELRNGAYDYAQVEVFAVNWDDLSQGIIKLRYGFFGEVMIVSSGFFKVELRGLTQLFSQTIGEVYSPECRADLGDDRCKVPLTPPVRSSVQSYQLGDRILVPIPAGVSSTVLVGNTGFELREVPNTWDELAGAVVNTNYFGQDILDPFSEQDSFRLLIKSESGSVSFRRNKDLMSDTAIPDFMAEMTVLAGGENVQFRLSAVWGYHAGTIFDPEVPLGDPYERFSEWITLDSVGQHDLSIPSPLQAANIPPGANYVRFTIEWQDAVPDLTYFVGYPLLDNVMIHKSSLEPQGNPTISGYDWVLSDNARYTGPTVWISPFSGSWNLELYPGPEAIEFAYQDVSLDDLSEYFLDIDEGTILIRAEAASGAATVGVQNFVSFVFYDETDAVIGTVLQEPQDFYGKGFWGPFGFTTEVPPLTRKVRVQLNTKNPTINARSRGVWDDVNVRIFQQSYENQGNYLSYGSVEFVCTQAGMTQITPPSYNYTLGAVTTDGSAQFTASEPLHMYVTTITEVLSNKQFKVSGINKEDSWFEWGVMEMLSGPNLKKKVEMSSWDNTTKIVTLALSLPYIPQVGDQLRMHTGCAKSRSVCHEKFDNMVNYRGEPDLPGTDQYFKIGAANTGGSAPPGSTTKV